MTQLLAGFAALAALLGMVAAIILSLFDGVHFPLPGWGGRKVTAAIDDTRALRRTICVVFGGYFLVAAALMASYFFDAGSTSDYGFSTVNTMRNIYPLGSGALFFVATTALWALMRGNVATAFVAHVCALVAGGALFGMSSAVTSVGLGYACFTAAFAIALGYEAFVLVYTGNTEVHAAHFAALAVYGLMCALIYMFTMFTYQLNFYDDDRILYWSFPFLVIGGGLVMLAVTFFATPWSSLHHAHQKADKPATKLPLTAVKKDAEAAGKQS